MHQSHLTAPDRTCAHLPAPVRTCPHLCAPNSHHRCSSQTSGGSVPARKVSLVTRGQLGVASLPVSRSMSTALMPAGASKGTLACPASAFSMNEVQIGTAAWVPLSPNGVLSSNPTH